MRSTVMVAFKMPKATDEESGALRAIQAGYEQAASVLETSSPSRPDGTRRTRPPWEPASGLHGVSGAAHLYCAAACAIANVESARRR
jgi:hypothetical protein